jgi:hypothetical protein
MGMAQDQRTPRSDEVDEVIAIGVEDMTPLATDNEARMATDSFPCAHRAVYTAWNSLLSSAKNLSRSLHGYERVLLAPRKYRVKKISAEKKKFSIIFCCKEI